MAGRSPFGWDLPPGVTQSMIDRAYGYDDEGEEDPEDDDYDGDLLDEDPEIPL